MSCFLTARLMAAGALLCALMTGCCAHSPQPQPVAPKGPDEVAAAYGKALKAGALDEAYALTSKEYRARVSRDDFKKRYRDEEARVARANAIEHTPVRAVGAEMTLLREGAEWRVAGETDGDARSSARAFVEAVDNGDFKKAYALLAAPLKARYTPERFASDFKAEALSKERLDRARAALGGEPESVGNEVRFSIGEGRALRLVREADGYRVLAIE